MTKKINKIKVITDIKKIKQKKKILLKIKFKINNKRIKNSTYRTKQKIDKKKKQAIIEK